MRIGAVLLVLLCLPGTFARADDQQAYLGIFVNTWVMKMAGMPEIKLPEGIKLPPGAAAMMPGQAQRRLDVRLWSPGIAPADARASLAIPAGLKLGPKLDLDIYRPKAEEAADTKDMPPGYDITKMTIKRYWGSSEKVKDGQPEVIRFDGLTPEQQRAMREQARRAQSAGSYFYKPDWTTAHWPTGSKPGTVEKDAGMPGHYELTTTYTGSVALDVPANVDFLAPIEMSGPNLTEAIAFEQPIAFRWQAIPTVLGYHASIVGMQGKDTIILWSSSEIRTDPGFSWDFLEMAQVRELVRTTAMMAGDRVDVTVPAGIFKDCDFVNFTMVGYGPGTALDKAQPLPRVQTKTTLNIMLGGKMMKLPGGFGGLRPGKEGE
jgi:hypothetical protein